MNIYTRTTVSTMSPRAASIVSSVFLLVGIGMLLLAGHLALAQRRFLAASVTTQGRVVENQARTTYNEKEDRKETMYYPVVAFTDAQGQVIRFNSDTGSSSPSFQINEAVPVRYLPSRSQEAKIDTFFQLWFGSMVAGCMGVIFTLVSLFSLWMIKKNKAPTVSAPMK